MLSLGRRDRKTELCKRGEQQRTGGGQAIVEGDSRREEKGNSRVMEANQRGKPTHVRGKKGGRSAQKTPKKRGAAKISWVDLSEQDHEKKDGCSSNDGLGGGNRDQKNKKENGEAGL